MLFQRSFLGLLQTSNRECLASVVSQRGHVHLPHQLQPSQPLVLQTVRECPLELKHVLELRHTSGLAESLAYPSKRDHAVPVTEPLFHAGCPVLAFLLVSLQYPSHSVRRAVARVEQQTHGMHLRSLVLTSRTSPFATPRRSATRRDSLPIAVPSHIQRNAHHAESREQRHRLNKRDAPLPNGKLGTTFDVSTIQTSKDR